MWLVCGDNSQKIFPAKTSYQHIRGFNKPAKHYDWASQSAMPDMNIAAHRYNESRESSAFFVR